MIVANRGTHLKTVKLGTITSLLKWKSNALPEPEKRLWAHGKPQNLRHYQQCSTTSQVTRNGLRPANSAVVKSISLSRCRNRTTVASQRNFSWEAREDERKVSWKRDIGFIKHLQPLQQPHNCQWIHRWIELFQNKPSARSVSNHITIQ